MDRFFNIKGLAFLLAFFLFSAFSAMDFLIWSSMSGMQHWLVDLPVSLRGLSLEASSQKQAKFAYAFGGIVAKNTQEKEISLIFSADYHGEGSEKILTVLREKKIKAGFFLTGNFLKNEKYKGIVKRIIDEGHYLGPHSYGHLHYNHYGQSKTLVSQKQFYDDLFKNISQIVRLQPKQANIDIFLPPFETYNHQISHWASLRDVTIISFSPNTYTYEDWMPRNHRRYRSSKQLINLLLNQADHKGIKGHILLVHMGVGKDRPDPLYNQLGLMIHQLSARGYFFTRIDTFLEN